MPKIKEENEEVFSTCCKRKIYKMEIKVIKKSIRIQASSRERLQ